jgi:hypothetical protein
MIGRFAGCSPIILDKLQWEKVSGLWGRKLGKGAGKEGEGIT